MFLVVYWGYCMTRTFAFVVMALLSTLGAIWLQQTLPAGMLLEVLVIVGLICIAALAVFGIWLKQSWGWALSIIFFAGSAANATLVYWSAREAFLPFLVVLAWNVVGLMLSCMHKTEHPYSVLNDAIQLENIMPRARTSRKARKSSRKSRKGRR